MRREDIRICDICKCKVDDLYWFEVINDHGVSGHYDCLYKLRKDYFSTLKNRRTNMNLKQRIERLESKVFADMYKCPNCGKHNRMVNGDSFHCVCGCKLGLLGDTLSCVFKVKSYHYMVKQ